jgi:glycosyltransferase involved in cell wall biosynthesis
MLKEKGIFDFVEAARLVRESYAGARFLIVGGTDQNPESIKESQLHAWVAEGILAWTGHVNDVRPWLAKSSVFVLPSYYREGLPRGNQEAMAMGRPIITTDWVGCRETVKDGVNGFLVPIREPKAVAQAMIRFIEAPELIEKMGLEGRRMAEERFDVHTINKQIMEVLGL